MPTEKQSEPVPRRVSARGLTWTLICLTSMLGLSCTTLPAQQETLSEYYWEVQNLRMQAGKPSTNAQAMRDLGIIYLRIGHVEAANEILSSALAHEKTDLKLRFYRGLSQELLDSKEAALETYERSPAFSTPSIYSRAMKGRIAWLRDEKIRRGLQVALAREALPPSDSLSSTSYAVFPFVCQSAQPEYAVLGKGLSELISRDLNQFERIETVEPGKARKALEMASALQARRVDMEPIRVGRMLGAGKVIEGRCMIGGDNRIEVELIVHDLIEDRGISVSGEERLEYVLVLEKTLIDRLIEELGIRLRESVRRVRPPPSSLEALMLFSQGLEQEDAGELERSATFYQRAVTLYPTFIPAVIRGETVENKILTRGTEKQDLMGLVIRLESYTTTPYMLDTHLQKLKGSIGSTFVPGQDHRKLPPGNVGELPEPPRPGGNR